MFICIFFHASTSLKKAFFFLFTKVVLLNGVLLSPACFLLCKTACVSNSSPHPRPTFSSYYFRTYLKRWNSFLLQSRVIHPVLFHTFTVNNTVQAILAAWHINQKCHQRDIKPLQINQSNQPRHTPLISYQCFSLNIKQAKSTRLKQIKECELDNH